MKRAVGLLLLLAVVLLPALPRPSAAQSEARARVRENFRREPQGLVLGRVEPGARFEVLETDGGWSRVGVEGWMWTASLQTTTREGFALVVSAQGGENLRAEPSGAILGRLEEGVLLEELGSRPGWTRVRRVGWIWTASLETLAAAAPTAAPSPASSSSSSSSSGPAGGAGPSASAADAPPAVFLGLPAGSALLVAPGGDTLARAVGDLDVQVIAREGGWARVRMEGWTWAPDAPTPVAAADVQEITPAMLTAEGGERHLGRGVRWTVQFISLERAEAVRTDFFEGEPFLLVRHGGPDGPFVYIAVPPDRISEVEGLTPLERITVTGRIRSVSSALTGTPIIDLLDIRRGSGG